MDVTPLIKANTQVIQSYQDNQVKISGQVFTQPVIVSAEKTKLWEGVTAFEDITFEAIKSIFKNAQIDVCLLGVGNETRFLPVELRRELKGHHFNVETMTVGAVCRTYNVLIAEGRQIAAALII